MSFDDVEKKNNINQTLNPTNGFYPQTIGGKKKETLI